MGRSFTLLRTLGEGAFGEVHLAEVRDDEDFVQTLAVKWLHARWTGEHELARRLRDEARLLGLLRHDHVVRVHGLTRIEGRLAILMEPVDGVDLARIGTAPPRAAAAIAAAVADALAAAWSTVPPGAEAPLRVVHRDIKPSNVMITARGGVKVMDFGVARATFDAREAVTRSQQFGTARYMAPERWLDGVAEAPSDVYSLGITLIELVGGAPVEQPRLSREGFAADLERALGSVEAPRLRSLAAEMCAFEPAARPTAEEVVDRCLALGDDLPGLDLRAWATVAVAAARQPAVTPRTGTVVVEDTPVPSTAELPPAPFTTAASPAPPARHGRPVDPVAGIVALAIVLAVAVAVPALRQPRGDDGAPGVTHEVVPAADEVPAAVEAAAGRSEPSSAPAPAEAPAPADAPPPADEPPPADGPRAEDPAPARDAAPADAPPPAPRPRAPEVADEALPSEVPADPEPSPVLESTVTFVVDPGLRVETPAGVVKGPRSALRLPSDQAHQLNVREGDARWPCTIVVGSGPTTVQVHALARGGCRQP